MYETYRGGDSLREFGIYLLTGEACGIGMRILADVSALGRQIIQEFMRVELNADAWNSETDGHEHVASIMLPTSILEDLWIFCHLRQNTANVFRGGYVSVDQWTETHYESLDTSHKHPIKTWTSQVWVVDDEHMKLIRDRIDRECFYIERSYRLSSHPGTGLDNEHAMSGRIT